MYIWKCWRNSRARFGTYLVLISLACAVVIGIAAKMGGPAGFQERPYGTGVLGLWVFGGRFLLGGVLAVIILFGALSLAAGVIGDVGQMNDCVDPFHGDGIRIPDIPLQDLQLFMFFQEIPEPQDIVNGHVVPLIKKLLGQY